MSSTWRLECSRALAERDEYEKADLDLFNSYTRLADRTAAAEAVHQHATVLGATSTASETPNPTGLAQIRLDLGDAQRSRADLQARLATCTEELERLRVGAKGDSKRISELSVERAGLATKVKDRDAELKGKAKLLEDIQDEIMTLNLQLNMAEERSKKLEEENQELVDRWMARKGQEADAMNTASKFS